MKLAYRVTTKNGDVLSHETMTPYKFDKFQSESKILYFHSIVGVNKDNSLMEISRGRNWELHKATPTTNYRNLPLNSHEQNEYSRVHAEESWEDIKLGDFETYAENPLI